MSATRHTGTLVDILQRRCFPGALHVEAGRIVAIEPLPKEEVEAGTLLPGFIDAHVHIESSLLTPPAFARLAVRHGTVAAVCDPHEIANVLGLHGVRYLLEVATRTPFHFAFGAPPCVPATGFETAGAKLGIDETSLLLADPRVTHLSEVMNVPGVLHADTTLLGKIAAARAAGRPVDGHAPGLRGPDLATYAAAGITTDHECTTLAEAREKLSRGMHIQIREGSAARNLDALMPLLDEAPDRTMLCSDDLHPDDLLRGHIDRLVRRAVAAGMDVYRVLQAACLNPIEHYRLPLGRMRVGDAADFIRVNNLREFEVSEVWLSGAPAWSGERCFLPRVGAPHLNRFDARPIEAEALRVPAQPGRIQVLVAQDRALMTDILTVIPLLHEDTVLADPARDVLKLVVKSRYDDRPPAIAFVRGFGLKHGAIASSVAHDSHNVIAVGTDDTSLLQAMNLVLQARGGLAVVGPHTQQLLPLPIAGLMSDQEGPEVAAAYAALQQAAHRLGCPLEAPLMTLSFLALLVIPKLKLSDQGLFDGEGFRFTGLFVDG